ncbi:peptidoglycan recognition family protein [Actinoplanes sp. NEAU-A12]|uniref:Peptidoglycan recognition family protein n=1 Tax=Actinoplanes sandaracinus TaxID=3045177 RepID=A0ABT6WW49_9ACTN|nr:peptidoglycan recognition family protein [Actinoplanes sandaracinus]MDI6103973.1 peptidoglycan recognition family protein [Actinoplanes sandaracinus]
MVSRRSLLRGATGLAATAPLALAGTRPAAAAGATVPETLSAARGAVPSGVAVTPRIPLTHLSVAGAGSVRLRTASGWQPWRALSGCPGGADRPEPSPHTLVPAAGALDYEVSSDAVSIVEINTVDGPARTVAAPETRLPVAAPPELCPRYLSRAAWGADESYRYNPDGTLDTPPAYYPVQTFTVHHSGEDVPETDPIAHIRGIYYKQAVTQDWGDIGYQLLIDAHGRVYEGTYSDPDRIPIFGPARNADGLPMMVNGSHVGGFNAGNIGVCLLGNFMQAPPTVAALRSLKLVLTLLAATTRIDPMGRTDYVNPVSGVKATIDTIAGHQDWNRANPAADATLCPGDQLYALLPAIRRDVGTLVRRLPSISVPAGR